MKVLGIDTATMFASLGLIEDEKVLAGVKFDIRGRQVLNLSYSEALLSWIDYIVKSLNLKISDIDGFAISIGPGSFTGLRIGLATVKGLSFATGKPIAAVPTLDALAFLSLYSKYPTVPILDAKKKEAYAAVYDTQDGNIKRLSPYFALTPENLVKKIPKEVIFMGPGVDIFKKDLEKLMGKKAHFTDGETSLPSGVAVAKLGWRKLKKGDEEDLASLIPLYIRESEAELKRRFV